MSTVQSLIDEVEESFRHGSSERRVTTLRRITDLFLDGADSFQDQQIGVFDDILCKLIDKIEREAIAELSGTIAPLKSAPPQLCHRLSWHDDIAIAGPVLRRSPLLTDSHLIEVAQRKSQLHLEAIANRAQLSEQVSDVLIDRGNSTVLTTVARNAGARISTRGYDTLVGKAQSDLGMASAIIARGDLSPEMFRKLVAQATAAVQQKLLAGADPRTKERLQGVLQSISIQIAQDAKAKVGDTPVATRLSVVDKTKLREELADYASAGRFAETALGLAGLTSLSAETIKRLMMRPDPDAVLILCKACGLGWQTVREILDLAATTRGHGPSNASAFMEQYSRMTREAAERVIRFLKVRKAASEADLKKMLAT
jgi:uncharacterized protein (DUF2336 family)